MYTDGSVEGGQGKGGGGGACVTRIEGNEIIRRKAAGNNCNSFKAETVAMIEAVKLIKDKSLKKVKIWTDSKAALTEALSNFKVNRDSNLTELKKLLSEEAKKADIAICLIPEHVEIGNEKANKEANIAKGNGSERHQEHKCSESKIKKEDKVLATMG